MSIKTVEFLENIETITPNCFRFHFLKNDDFSIVI